MFFFQQNLNFSQLKKYEGANSMEKSHFGGDHLRNKLNILFLSDDDTELIPSENSRIDVIINYAYRSVKKETICTRGAPNARIINFCTENEMEVACEIIDSQKIESALQSPCHSSATSSTEKLKIMSWNIRGGIDKKLAPSSSFSEKFLLSESENKKIDFLWILDTRTRPTPQIDGYNSYRMPTWFKNGHGSGLCLLYRKEFSERIQIIEKPSFYGIWVLFPTEKVLFCGTYFPPSKKLKTVFQKLFLELKELDCKGYEIYLFGDLNGPYPFYFPNHKTWGKLRMQLLTDNMKFSAFYPLKFRNSNSENAKSTPLQFSTFQSSNGLWDSTIDWCLSNSRKTSQNMGIEIIKEFPECSDHFPIQFEVDLSACEKAREKDEMNWDIHWPVEWKEEGVSHRPVKLLDVLHYDDMVWKPEGWRFLSKMDARVALRCDDLVS